MATRKASSSNQEGNKSNKRRRVLDESSTSSHGDNDNDDGDSTHFPRYSLRDLNDNCLVCVLSFLHYEDLNSFAICNRHCRAVRGHDSLDQTRSGTVMLRARDSEDRLSFLRSFRAFTDVFSGHRTHLKIENVVNVTNLVFPSGVHVPYRDQLEGVHSLDISRPTQAENKDVEWATLSSLSGLVPNLQELDGSNVNAIRTVGGAFDYFCPHLRRVIWKGGDGSLDLLGRCFERSTQLKELVVDDSWFALLPLIPWGVREIARSLRHDGTESQFYMLMNCRGLERVSMKNVSWAGSFPTIGLGAILELETIPVTQEMLIRFVRGTPTLRWLRSDLTEANVAMLQQERPEVTFVSD